MIELYILGAPHLQRKDGETTHAVPLQPKLLALLAYLSLAPAGYGRRDTLLALFWPELDEQHARNALSQAVYRLRDAVGKEAVISRGAEELHLSPTTLWCDTAAFEQALHDDRPAAALDLYRGPLLDGLHVGSRLRTLAGGRTGTPPAACLRRRRRAGRTRRSRRQPDRRRTLVAPPPRPGPGRRDHPATAHDRAEPCRRPHRRRPRL